MESSPLPIILINTGGQAIVDAPRIVANMYVIHNGPNQLNHIEDFPNEYAGKISIEIRGSSSQSFPKKSYGLETQTDSGENRNVSILGMPRENDWILHGPFSDKSLIRNALTFRIANRFTTYAPRTELCELVIDSIYQGVYVFMEKIKRDDDRVDIGRLDLDDNQGDSVTGGYIVKLDKSTGNGGDGWSGYFDDYFQYEYPDADEITLAQRNYIRNYITRFEEVLAGRNFLDPDSGYRRFIDVNSFLDFIIMNELGRNVDGYRLSTFLHKERDSRGGKIRMGPIWDFNLAFGNANYCTGPETAGWVLNFNTYCPQDGWTINRWWDRLLSDKWFTDQLIQRWKDLREKTLSNDSLLWEFDRLTENLDGPQTRNFQKWRILGEYVWPNAFIGSTHTEELEYLRFWLLDRVAWMDANIHTISSEVKGPYSFQKFEVYPNPFQDEMTINFLLSREGEIEFMVRNLQGQIVGYEVLIAQPGFESRLVWKGKRPDGKPLAAGIYIYSFVRNGEVLATGKISRY
ncbi:MAG: CotH kinase family protein [Bacteroidetes bacterium]|nr:CotH kinase family protein [Bacteroidota bacterium]